MESIIIAFYAKGMSASGIVEQIHRMYDFAVSISIISRITNVVASEMVRWQNHPIEDLYIIVWMDEIVFKVREISKVISKTVYRAVGLNRDERKEILGMWLGKNESSAFWMGVLTDLKTHSFEDILISSTDNLNGFTKPSVLSFLKPKPRFVWSIKSGEPANMWLGKTEADMKHIYTAPTKQAAEAALNDFAGKWESKYSYAIQLMELPENRIILPIRVDQDGNNQIEIIPQKASMGHLNGYRDPEYIESLETISLPFLKGGKFRAFPVDGDSMPPL